MIYPVQSMKRICKLFKVLYSTLLHSTPLANPFYAKKAFFQLILGKLSLIVLWRGNIRRIQENWPEMITAVFQGGIHPKITSGWVSPFINRNDDISGNLNRKQNRRAVRPLAHFQDSLHFDAVLLLSELAGGGGSGGRRYELLQKC